MLKSLLGLLLALLAVAGCSTPQPAAKPQAAADQSAGTANRSRIVAAINPVPAANSQEYETVFVPPPTGSLLGGGSVRVPKQSGTGENALSRQHPAP